MLPVAVLSSFLSNTTVVAMFVNIVKSSELHFFDNLQLPNISWRTIASTIVMLAMMIVSAFNIMPLLQCAFIAAAIMLLIGCCTPEQAVRSINGEILMVFAGSVVVS